MSITLELTDEEEATLRQAAQRAGVEVGAFVRRKVLELVTAPDLLAEARFLQSEGARAISDAQRRLTEQGIGYVTGDELHIVLHSSGQ